MPKVEQVDHELLSALGFVPFFVGRDGYLELAAAHRERGVREGEARMRERAILECRDALLALPLTGDA